MVTTLAVWSVVVALGGASAVYLSTTILALLPPNPLTLQLWPLVRAVQEPFFVQNWHLFAPNPIRSNLVMNVRCRTEGLTTPWRDPHTPLLLRHQRHRLSPVGKMLRLPQNAMFMFLGRRSDEWRALVCRRARDHPLCRGQDPASRRQRDLGWFVLQRLASAACDDIIRGRRTEQVQVAILLHTPPPWSQRHRPQDAGTTQYRHLPWAPYAASHVGGDETRR